MKNIFSKAFTLLALGVTLSSCEKNAIVEQTELATTGSNIRFSVAAQDAPMVNFYLNGNKVTAKSPTTTGRQTGLVWTSTLSSAMHPANYGYINVEPGNYTITAIDTTTTVDPATNKHTTTLTMNKIVEGTVQLNELENTTTYLVGQAGSYELLTVKDNIPPYDFSKSYIRFVNVMSGAPGRFTIKAKGTDPVTDTVLVADKVPFKEYTDYVAITPGVYNMAVFLEGKSGVYTTWTAGNILPGRTYTFFTRGTYAASPGTVNRQLIRER
ncbi:MAG: DUF4397 domain-containing protein [Rufibacter sp.]